MYRCLGLYRVEIVVCFFFLFCVFFCQAEDGIRYLVRSRGLGDVYKRQPFDPQRTTEKTFFLNNTEKKMVPMMEAKLSLRFVEGRPGYQMLELPYAGEDFSMVVMLSLIHI